MDAPEKIWVFPCAGCTLLAAETEQYNPDAQEYLRSDIAQAMVAEAREKALREAAKAAGNIAVDTLKDEEPSASLVRLQFRRRASESAILALIDKDKADG